jgi:sugar (pentulose or hexulose) kinase
MTTPALAHLGLDIGTTNVKSVALDADGRLRALNSAPTPWTVVPTGRQMDAWRLWATVSSVLAEVVTKIEPERVASLGITAMGQTGTVVDGDGSSMLPFVCWDDIRARPAADRLAAELGPAAFGSITGLPVGTSWTVCQIAQAGSDNPGIDLSAGRWLGIAEWVVYRLTGTHATDLSLASESGLLDLHAGMWSQTLAQWADWSVDRLPPICEAGSWIGTVRSESAPVDRLRGAVVVLAGHDHQVAAFGADALHPEIAFDSCGTAETVIRCCRPLDADEVRRALGLGLRVGRHLSPGLQVVSASWSTTARLMADLAELGVADIRALGPTPLIERAIVRLEENGEPLDGGLQQDRWAEALLQSARTGSVWLTVLDQFCGPASAVVLAGGWTHYPPFVEARRRVVGRLSVSPVEQPGAVGAARLSAAAVGRGPVPQSQRIGQLDA